MPQSAAVSTGSAVLLACWRADVLACCIVLCLPCTVCRLQASCGLPFSCARNSALSAWAARWRRLRTFLSDCRGSGICLDCGCLVLVLRVLLVPRLHLHLHLHLPPRSHLPQQRITDIPPHLHPTSTSTSTSTSTAPAVLIASAVAPQQLTVSSQLQSRSSYCSGHLT